MVTIDFTNGARGGNQSVRLMGNGRDASTPPEFRFAALRLRSA